MDLWDGDKYLYFSLIRFRTMFIPSHSSFCFTRDFPIKISRTLSIPNGKSTCASFSPSVFPNTMRFMSVMYSIKMLPFFQDQSGELLFPLLTLTDETDTSIGQKAANQGRRGGDRRNVFAGPFGRRSSFGHQNDHRHR